MNNYYSDEINRVQAFICSGWFWALFAALVCSAGCISGPPAKVRIHRGELGTSEVRPARFDSTELTLTTFNVWGLPRWINGASNARYQKIACAVEGLQSDVVLYQEVWTKQSFSELAEVAKGSGCRWWTASARNRGSFLGQNGLLTLSKYPIVGSEVRHFSEAQLPDSLMHKGTLKTTIELPSGQRVNVWNVHLQDGNCPELRAKQVHELARWIRQSEDSQIADIVGGDFNFTADSTEFADFVAAIGPSVHQIAGEAPVATWDGLRSMPKGGEVLDHVFIRRRAIDQSVHASPERVLAASRTQDRLSDHMGVKVSLSFAPTAEPEPAILANQTPGAEVQTVGELTAR
jgi:endonuclease/exonuclease/phosphatase family metal-dependent hydrolase